MKTTSGLDLLLNLVNSDGEHGYSLCQLTLHTTNTLDTLIAATGTVPDWTLPLPYLQLS